MNDTAPLNDLVRNLSRRAMLNDSDRTAIFTLPHVCRSYAAGAYLMREGDPAERRCCLITKGFAFKQKSTMEGKRQIVSLHLPGEILNLPHLFLEHADYSAQALTHLETAEIDSGDIRALLLGRPRIAEAMWIETMIDASILREWITNVGRRDARARVAHLLCEIAVRIGVTGEGSKKGYYLPMTQEQIGDATGLTSVHVNRTLGSLISDGIINRDGHNVSFSNWDRLRSAGQFSALYLHLDQLR